MRLVKIIFLIYCCLFFYSVSYSQYSGIKRDSVYNFPVPKGGEYVRLNHSNGSISSEGFVVDGEPEGWWRSYDNLGNIISEGNRKNHSLDGIWTFYKEGEKISEITYINNIKNGFSKYYTKEGRLEEFYINGILEGKQCSYDTNGFIIKSIPFIKGEKNGLARFYNKDGEIVYIKLYRQDILISQQTINSRDKLGRKQGLWKGFYGSDKINWELTYMDDLKNGYYKEYDSLGNIVKIEKYNMGILIKDAPELAKVEIYTEYYANGKPKLKVGYKNGKPEGICREYDSITGKVVKGTIFKDGEIVGGGIIDDNGYFQDDWKEYYSDGTLRCEGKYRKGKKSGSWKYYYPSGSIEQEGEFKNGKYDGRWIWYYTDGSIRLQQEYYNGLPDGEMEEYDQDGKKIAFGKYMEGLEEGEWQYINGQEKIQGIYKSGERSGLWRSYWNTNSKALSFRGSFIDGLPHGKHYYYWENGNIREEIRFSMGRRVGSNIKYDEDGNVIVQVLYNTNEEEVKYNGKRTLSKEEER